MASAVRSCALLFAPSAEFRRQGVPGAVPATVDVSPRVCFAAGMPRNCLGLECRLPAQKSRTPDSPECPLRERTRQPQVHTHDWFGSDARSPQSRTSSQMPSCRRGARMRCQTRAAQVLSRKRRSCPSYRWTWSLESCRAPEISRMRVWDARHRATMRRASSTGTVSSSRPCTSGTGQGTRHTVVIGAIAAKRYSISDST